MKLQTMNTTSYNVINDIITLQAGAKTDFFVSPFNGEEIASAAFLYEEVCGDFTLKAYVKHDFSSVYDACTLLAYDASNRWAKACFEYSDFHTNTVVSVMTNMYSDDANGVNIDGKGIWLQLSRKENVFAVHYSYDDVTYDMVRLTRIPMSETLKVGFSAQSPLGEGGEFMFQHYELKYETPQDIRKGK